MACTELVYDVYSYVVVPIHIQKTSVPSIIGGFENQAMSSLVLMREKNSVLVRGSSLKDPSMQLVVVLLRGLLTPLIIIHMCLQEQDESWNHTMMCLPCRVLAIEPKCAK